MNPTGLLLTCLKLCLLACIPFVCLHAKAQSAGEPTSLGEQAAAAQKRGDAPLAIELYQQAVEADPGYLEGWWALGNLEYGADRYTDARAALTHYIDQAPKAGAALALRGLCEFETADYQASLTDIEAALDLGAANQARNGQILLYHEALLLTRLGQFEAAIAKYTIFLKQGIVNSDVATGIALAGLRMPLLPQEIPPIDAPLVAATGQAAIQVITGDPAEGRKAFAAVAAAFPNRPFVHYFCGYLLFSKNPGDALEEFKLEVAGIPASPLAHAMLAWTSEMRGEYAEALPDAQAAVEEDPALPMSQLVLGRALLETTGALPALPHLDQVVQAQPANLEAHMSLAKAYSKLGRKDDASRERLLCLKLSGEGEAANANR